MTGYWVRGLASPHPFLGATPLASEARAVLASAVFFLVQFVVGDMDWCGFFWLLGGERCGGGGSAVFSLFFFLTLRQAEQVRLVLRLWTDSVCSRFQLCHGGESVQCKLFKSRRFHSTVFF